jgi:hypothetical protein
MAKIKNLTLILVSLIVVISASVNVIKQYSTLKQADSKILSMEIRIKDLKDANLRLKNQIEYATSSAYIQQQIRDKFGLGTQNDAWLILPEEKKLNLQASLSEEENKDNVFKWIELFTK